MEEWNCAGERDLFSLEGETLDEVFSGLVCRDDNFTSSVFPNGSMGQVVQTTLFAHTLEAPAKRRRTILKQPKSLGNCKQENLKKVTFDVERFAADECGNSVEREEARVRIAVRLGARPSKKRFVNYRELKRERGVKKHTDSKTDKLAALKALKKFSMKKKKAMKCHRK